MSTAEIGGDDWDGLDLDQKAEALGFSGTAFGNVAEREAKKLHEIFDAFAGASSIIDEVGEEVDGSDCETCKRIDAMLKSTLADGE